MTVGNERWNSWVQRHRDGWPRTVNPTANRISSVIFADIAASLQDLTDLVRILVERQATNDLAEWTKEDHETAQ